MCNNETCLGSFLFVIILFFALLIYFLLKYRQKFLAQTNQLTPDDIWKTISQRASLHGLSKSDLLYGIYQDKTTSLGQLVIKDSTGEPIGSIEYPTGSREFKLNINNEDYLIWYPLTWRRTALLKKINGDTIASFERLPFSYIQHKIIIPEIGIFLSQAPFFNLRTPFDYCLNGKVTGITQGISATRKIGQVAVFPSDISLIYRVFILSICARGV